MFSVPTSARCRAGKLQISNLSLFFSIALVLSVLLPLKASAKTLDQAIYRPTFHTTAGEVSAGTAFVVSYSDRLYVVSAQHLIGVAGGMKKQYFGKDMPTLFNKVTLTAIVEGHKPLSSEQWVVIPDAAPLDDRSLVNDVFIAKLASSDATPFVLADAIPKVGDTVYVYAKTVDGDNLLHKATMGRVKKDELAYIFEKPFNIRATSGAPVLNERFEVIGINLVGGSTRDGKAIGWANPVTSITKYILTPSEQKQLAVRKHQQALMQLAERYRPLKRQTVKIDIQGGQVTPPKQALYHPAFKLDDHYTFGGLAFLVKEKGKKYFVTAHQWLGLSGGLERDYHGDDMKKHYKGAVFFPVFDGLPTIENNAYIHIGNAQPAIDGFDNLDRDIFLAPVNQTEDVAFELASTQAKDGEEVLIYSPIEGSDVLFHKAKVVQLDDGAELAYAFKDAKMLDLIMPGAPVLNRQMQVLGFHVAYSEIVSYLGNSRLLEQKTGREIGVANPNSLIKQHISNYTK